MSQPASRALSDQHCAQLEALLRDLIDHARTSADAAAEHRRAIASADPQRLARCIALQQDLASSLAGLDARRAELLKSIGLRTPVPLSVLATAAPAPRRAALAELATSARAHLAAAHRARQAVALASQSLLAHMQGLLQQIARQISQTKTYGPTRAHAVTTPSGCVDVTL